MTKKDFERAAEIIRNTVYPNELCKKFSVGSFIKFFRSNATFDSEQFIKECGVKE